MKNCLRKLRRERGLNQADLADALKTGAAEALRKVQTTGELDKADSQALLAALRKLATSLAPRDV